MVRFSTLRPNRGLVFPFSIAFFPMLWFVLRETPVRVVDGQRVVTPLSRTLTLTLVALGVSYLIAVIIASAFAPRESPTAWQQVFFRPTNGALVTLLVLWTAIVVYAILNSTVELPWWSELVVGIPLLWPLLVAILVTYAIGNAFPLLQAFAIQATLAVVGLALSAAWIYILSTGIAQAVFTAE